MFLFGFSKPQLQRFKIFKRTKTLGFPTGFYFFSSGAGTGYGVHIYVLDSGVRRTHLEFSGRFGNGYDATKENGDYGQVGPKFL